MLCFTGDDFFFSRVFFFGRKTSDLLIFCSRRGKLFGLFIYDKTNITLNCFTGCWEKLDAMLNPPSTTIISPGCSYPLPSYLVIFSDETNSSAINSTFTLCNNQFLLCHPPSCFRVSQCCIFSDAVNAGYCHKVKHLV